MKKTFVFFTSKDKLKELHPSLSDDSLFGFDETKIVGISKNKTPNHLPYFVLIKDTITLPNPDDNGDEHNNSKTLLHLLNRIDEIYLVIHKTNKSNYLETFQRLFKEKIKSYIIQSHVTDSIYNRFLKPVFENDSLSDLSLLESDLLKEFPDNQLDSIIHLHKTVGTYRMQNGNRANDNFLNSLIDKKYYHAKETLAKDTHNDGNNGIKDLDSLLEWTSKKIVEISKK